MGFMDFLKKKNDVGTGADGLNFDSTMPTDLNSGSQQPAFGMDLSQQSNLSPSMSMSSMGNNTFGQPAPSQSIQPESSMERDIQMMSLKLDAIKSELDSVSQRLKNIEMIAEREQSKTTKKWY